MDQIRNAINNGATSEQLAALPIPATYRAAVIEKQDVDMFAGVASADKDPRKSI